MESPMLQRTLRYMSRQPAVSLISRVLEDVYSVMFYPSQVSAGDEDEIVIVTVFLVIKLNS